MDNATLLHLINVLCATMSLAFAGGLCALSQAYVVKSALDCMARQPELSGDLRLTMIIGLAMIESMAIYSLLIGLILLFVKW